jgi:hypothetical protein
MHPLDTLSPAARRAIINAAILSHGGRHPEAEAARFAGGYHNLDIRKDADKG